MVMNIKGDKIICIYLTNNITYNPKITHIVICRTLEYAANPLPSTNLDITITLAINTHLTSTIPPKFHIYKIPNFKTAPASTIEPTIEASTCTFGNHICNLNIGNLAIPNSNNKKPINIILLFMTTPNLSTNLKNRMKTLAPLRS